VTRRARAVPALVAAGLLAACGGGGGGGGGGGPTAPPTATPAPVSIGFSPTGTGGANSLALTRVSGDATTLVLSLEATSVTDLYGVAFDLTYPAAVLDFDEVTEGTFLDQGGIDTTLQVAETPDGTLVVGLSRLGQVSGRSGTGTLLRLEFRRQAPGSGDVRFEDNQAFNAAGNPITGITWSGGRVTVP
jgi:hypothetical protein